ncbi:MAG: GNAT family N-acetyltransferase [Candidatus Nanopelagicales bacterium]
MPTPHVPTPALRTERLDLEPLRVEHADEMVDLLADRRLYAFYADEASPSLDELRERYARQVRGASDDGTQVWHNWILRVHASGEAAGFVQATVTHDSDDREVAELAWVVGTAYQGRGLAREAAAAVRDELISAGAGTVIAHIAPGNGASEAVARAIGLAPTDESHDGETRWQLTSEGPDLRE